MNAKMIVQLLSSAKPLITSTITTFKLVYIQMNTIFMIT